MSWEESESEQDRQTDGKGLPGQDTDSKDLPLKSLRVDGFPRALQQPPESMHSHDTRLINLSSFQNSLIIHSFQQRNEKLSSQSTLYVVVQHRLSPYRSCCTHAQWFRINYYYYLAVGLQAAFIFWLPISVLVFATVGKLCRPVI